MKQVSALYKCSRSPAEQSNPKIVENTWKMPWKMFELLLLYSYAYRSSSFFFVLWRYLRCKPECLGELSRIFYPASPRGHICFKGHAILLKYGGGSIHYRVFQVNGLTRWRNTQCPSQLTSRYTRYDLIVLQYERNSGLLYKSVEFTHSMSFVLLTIFITPQADKFWFAGLSHPRVMGSAWAKE